MINKVILMGRLVTAPELRRTQTDMAVSSFSIAVDRSYVRQGEDRQTDFINIVAWDKQAEFVTNHFTKGKSIAIIGRLMTRKWKDKQGNNRTSVEVIANEVYFVGKKEPQGDSTNEAAYSGMDMTDEELPF